MLVVLRRASALLGMLTVITGLFYPLAVTGIAHAVFPDQAEGSLVKSRGRTVGSHLIGQQFDAPRYFWGRPSWTSSQPYNASASLASNFAPSNRALYAAVKQRILSLQEAASGRLGVSVPPDLVEGSASGLDPHICPSAALFQVSRVAQARRLAEGDVRKAVAEAMEQRSLGFLGEARVNVLQLNLALDALDP